MSDSIDLRNDFSRARRLLTASDYRFVFENPIRSQDRYFKVLCRASKDSSVARLGLAISKKLVRKAVDRNRIKRIVRESFRHHQRQLKGFDIVVLAQPGLHRQSNRTLFQSLSTHWVYLRQVKDPSF